MELFPITLPKSNICTETELYYRASQPVQYEEQTGQLTVKRKTVLTLDTYFNCFSYQKYLQYTSVQVLEVHLQLQGQFQIRLLKAQLEGKNVQRTVLLTQQVQQERLMDTVLLYDLSRESGNGFLYLELTALSKQAVFGGGFYASPIAEEQLQPTKIAAVICTYQREAYVQRNLHHLAQTIFAAPEQEAAQHLEVFVVDNGKTLQREEIETSHVRLFPNKNCGGSGGFTRGIIEALRRKAEFSHVLLMDDDILLESNVLIKTTRFLQILRPEHQDLAIGGSMLRLDQMNVQHEAGGKWTGYKVKTSRANIDLCQVKNVLQNEQFEQNDFCGWWYLLIPLSLIDESNLPMPYFIKNDDIEYGLRVTKKLDFLNGIGVWHEPFEKKLALPLEYYYMRNILITNMIHEESIWNSIYMLIRRVGKCMVRRNYSAAQIPLQAINDVLAGFDYFLQVRSDLFHKDLTAICKEYDLNKKEKVGFVKTGMILLWYCITLFLKYSGRKKEYQARYHEACNCENWCRLLEIHENYEITQLI